MGSPEVERTGLLDRLIRSSPSMLALVAPAGYGKSVLARQYLAARPGRLCDCEGTRDDLDLVRRLLPELSEAFEDGSLSVNERVERALEGWRSVRGSVVFENADRAQPEVGTLFARLLDTRPAEVTIVLVGRDAHRLINFARFGSPHNAVTLRAADLAFSVREAQEFLDVDEARAHRCFAASLGWPIALLVLRRIVDERRGGERLESLERVAFEELRDYLADEVLSTVPTRLMQMLFACAAIPRAVAADLRDLFADPQRLSELREFSTESPFLTHGDDGTFDVHPLFAMLVLEHQQERRTLLVRDLARLRENDGDVVRAAELHESCGDQRAAARQLARHEVLADRRPSRQYRRVLESLDRAVVARHPRLWAMTALTRLFRAQGERLADEAEAMLRTLAPDAAPMERLYVVMIAVVVASYAGPAVEANEILDEFAASIFSEDPPRTLLDGYVAYLRAFLLSRQGAYASAEQLLKSVLAVAGEIDLTVALALTCLGADVARPRGERALEVQFLQRAHDSALDSKLSNVVALVLAEALCGAWFVCDNSAYASALESLVRCCQTSDIRGFGYLIACAEGKRAEPGSHDVASSVIFGRLIAVGRSRDAAERVRNAEAALSTATRTGQPFLVAIAAVALGACDELRFADCIEVARQAASRCESPELNRAVGAVSERRSDAGMLNGFLLQLARGRSDAPPPMALDVLAGRVRVDGDLVSLSGRELELLIALGLKRESTPRARLAALLWPDLSDAAARNALSVCLHRLRTHLRRGDLVVRSGNGYCLHDDAVVDVWEIERAALVLRSRDDLRESERAALERAWSLLREESFANREHWEWFKPMVERMRSLRIDVAHRLAVEALRQSDSAGALQFAHDALSLDDCDEPAHEAVVRAHLLGGDRSAALRAFRRYREALHRELDAQPSAAIASLVEE